MISTFLRAIGIFGTCALTAAPVDLDREIVLAPNAGASFEDREIARWQDRVRGGTRPEDFEKLGWAYVAKARRTLDAGYYKLAEKTVDLGEATAGSSDDFRLLRGHVWHNLHRFPEAEAVACDLARRRGSPRDHALLADVLMERGRLDEAVAALQQFVDRFPGTEAYSRISYVRWLRGDLPGAVAAMREAEMACGPRDAEARAWTRVRLSGYALQAGDRLMAAALAESALSAAPEYPPGLLAQGRALLALGRNPEALLALQRAAELNPLPEYRWWLADALRRANRATDAEREEAAIVARGAADDPRTLALYLATRGEQTARAVRIARLELSLRADAFTHDALAWALYRDGDLAAADAAMRLALAEGTKDARLSLHAGAIAQANGRSDEARRHFEYARAAGATLTAGEWVTLVARLKELNEGANTFGQSPMP